MFISNVKFFPMCRMHGWTGAKDKSVTKSTFTKEFYKYTPLRSLEEIRKDIIALEKEDRRLMNEF